MDWVDAIKDRLNNLDSVRAETWLTVGVWALVGVVLIALIYSRIQIKRSRDIGAQTTRPYVTVYMEPHAADWHVIELVVRNFGQTAAYDIQLSWVNPPTVADYENEHDGKVEISELQLPSHLPILAPGQDWRTVWDSALERYQLEGPVESAFEGVVKYYDNPRGRGHKRRAYESVISLDWANLQPVQRVELMTSHDLAKRERNKLELLRAVMAYFHYASQETRADVYRHEIERMNRATEEAKDRWMGRRDDPPAVRVARVDPLPPPAAFPAQPDPAPEVRQYEQPAGLGSGVSAPR